MEREEEREEREREREKERERESERRIKSEVVEAGGSLGSEVERGMKERGREGVGVNYKRDQISGGGGAGAGGLGV